MTTFDALGRKRNAPIGFNKLYRNVSGSPSYSGRLAQHVKHYGPRRISYSHSARCARWSGSSSAWSGRRSESASRSTPIPTRVEVTFHEAYNLRVHRRTGVDLVMEDLT